MLAMRLGRAVALHDTDLAARHGLHDADFGTVLYNFSAVLPLIDIRVPARLGWPTASTRVVATDHRSASET